MVPLDFLLATPLLWLALTLAMDPWRPVKPIWLVGFLTIFAAFLILIGVRFGYDIAEIGRIQSYVAILLPPLGFLAFRNPPPSLSLIVHAFPMLGLAFVETASMGLRDAYLAVVTFGYAACLARDGLRAGETLSWAPMRAERALTLGLWAAVGMLTLSGATDAMIAFDLSHSGGMNIPDIVGRSSIFAAITISVSALVFWLIRRNKAIRARDPDNAALVEAVQAMLLETELYRDPDLTLRRIARRTSAPEKRLSRAINSETGGNLSQFVNKLRIEAAMRDLATSDVSITSVMLQSGFMTKSNFNREFKRVTGSTPTSWRQTHRQVG